MSLITKLFQFVLLTSKKYNIDESHGLSHSMNVLHFAHNIYEAEKINYPILESQSKIIYVSSILHDMCDKKYLDEYKGLKEINEFLDDKLTPTELDITKQIINTMSYSKVKKQGFPQLYEYQMAYHVVREADLLAAYDFDRCMLYNIHLQTKTTFNNPTPTNNDIKIIEAFNNANDLFHNRVLKHNQDNLFITEYSKHNYLPLQINAIKRINTWKKILKTPLI